MRWLLKRWRFWAGTGLVLVAVVGSYLLFPAPRISQANCDRIRLGMTNDEVGELLGDKHPGSGHGVIIRRDRWLDDDGNVIEVEFDWTDHLVTGKKFTVTDIPFTKRLKRRIERRIKALWP